MAANGGKRCTTRTVLGMLNQAAQKFRNSSSRLKNITVGLGAHAPPMDPPPRPPDASHSRETTFNNSLAVATGKFQLATSVAFWL